MYSLRIHSVDAPRPSSVSPPPAAADDSPSTSSSSVPPPQPSGATAARSPSPVVLESRGIVHLYRSAAAQPSSSTSTSASSADPFPLLPASRGTLLFVLAIPSSLSVEDFLRFCCGSHVDHFLEIRAIRDDGIEDRYSVLIQLNDQKNADNFYLDFNGWRFPSLQEEICHALFIGSVYYTELSEVALTPLLGSTELPTCPVCLERLDQDISGIATTGCDHLFQCQCISKWANLSCPVCRFCKENSDKPVCSVCETNENLWICMICGFVGCGRYKEGHAIRHWKDTQHCYSLDLTTQRIWDYVGDTHVHRLNPSKSDSKMAELKHRCRLTDGNCETCECSEDSGISGVIFSSKVEAVVDEYSRLLASQLENQRQYYESQIIEAKGKREKLISEAVEKALSVKLQSIQLEIEKITEEKKIVADMNEKLLKSQDHLREKFKEIEEREKLTLKLKDEKIHDLEEEIRDITFYIEAQKAVSNVAGADDIREGTVLSLPHQEQKLSSSSNRRSSKINRRRH